jgi:hypothetical protein
MACWNGECFLCPYILTERTLLQDISQHASAFLGDAICRVRLILARCQRYRRVRTAAHTPRSSHCQLDKSSILNRQYCRASDCVISLISNPTWRDTKPLNLHLISRSAAEITEAMAFLPTWWSYFRISSSSEKTATEIRVLRQSLLPVKLKFLQKYK